ncbi:MAG: hypothetical protein AAGG50_01260 [Bacteroidota bacterium]
MTALRNAAMAPAIALVSAFLLLDYLLYLVSGYDGFSLTVASGLALIILLATGRDAISPVLVRRLAATAAFVMAFMPGLIVVCRGLAWTTSLYDYALAGGLAVACVLGFSGVFLLKFQLDRLLQGAE